MVQDGTNPPERRACSLRAVVIGSVLAAIAALLTPINSLVFGNSMLYGSYVPPVLVVLLAILVLGVNPILGRFRFVRGELVTILVLVLCLGGVVGQGLIRSVPGFFVGPATHLPNQKAADQLVEPRPVDEAALAELSQAVLTAFDADGDGRLDSSEQIAVGPSLVPGESLGLDDIAAALRPPEEAYRFDTRIAVGVPETGRVDPASPRHQLVVGGYNDSLEQVDTPDRSGYRDWLTLRSGDEVRRYRILSGPERDAALRAGQGVIDPANHPAARALLRVKTGATVPFAGREWEVVAIDHGGVPWGDWWWALLRWSPLLLGAMIAMLALSGIVRHQWVVGERLSFPIAKVLGSLTDAKGTGVWRSQGLWVAAAIPLIVHGWRTAYAAGWMPFDITVTLRLHDVIPRDTFIGQAPYLGALSTWNLWFTVIAMTFLVTPEVGFSLWGTFVGVLLISGLLISSGFEITSGDLQASAVGGAAVLAVVLLWIGRFHYWAVLKAAFRLGDNPPEARAAAPYIWLLLLGCGAMLGFMLAVEIPLAAAAFVVLAFLLTTLVLARVVAESGVPFASLANPGRVGELTMLWVGPSTAAGALIPLAMIGYILGNGDRERLMAHALNAQAIDGERGGVGMHKVSALVLWSSVIGVVAAFAGMLIAGYFGRGAIAGDGFANAIWGLADWRIGQQLSPGGEGMIADRRSAAWGAYLAGGIIVAVISLGRLRFSAWPLHPVGFILLTGWVTTVCWFSYFIGWMFKVLVLRYGGNGLYLRLVPVAVGLVLGDAVAVVGVMLLRIGFHLAGAEFPDVTILPK